MYLKKSMKSIKLKFILKKKINSTSNPQKLILQNSPQFDPFQMPNIPFFLIIQSSFVRVRI